MLPIEYNEYGLNQSRIFHSESMPMDYRNLALELTSDYNTTCNDHWLGVDPDYFSNDSYLIGNFSNLGISYDRLNKPFIALIESKEIDGIQLSWYGSQFHPEKAQYQFTPDWTPNFKHNVNTIIANQYLSTFFINECRERNDNVMDKKTYDELIIYNFVSTFIGKNQTDPFNNCYWFPQPNNQNNY